MDSAAALPDFLKHLLVLPWILLVIYTLRPGGPEKSYELNRRCLPVLLPGRWKEKDYFVRWTRRLGVFWLLVLGALYLFLLKA